MNRPIVCIAFALLLGACKPDEVAVQPQPAPAPAPKPKPAAKPAAPVTTDRELYTMEEGPFGSQTQIVATYTAPANQDIYLINCNGQTAVGLQRPVGDRWEHVWAPGMNACMSAPIVIRAGQSRTTIIDVESGIDVPVTTRMTDMKVESGTYRVIWHGLLGSYKANASPPGENLPVEQSVSAPFRIVGAPPRDPLKPSPATPPREVQSVEPAHGARVTNDARVRVQLAGIFGDPHLYVDREPVEYSRSGDTIEFTPRRRWTPGLHTLRVIYQDAQKRTRWYAWSFTKE